MLINKLSSPYSLLKLDDDTNVVKFDIVRIHGAVRDRHWEICISISSLLLPLSAAT